MTITRMPRLATIEQVSQKYNVPVQTVHTWLRRGQISDYGKEEGKMGRPSILVDEIEIEHRLGKTDPLDN